MKNIKKTDIIYWITALLVCNLGIAFCTKADLGLSMIAAPPYILHVWLRDIWPWFTQGTSEYVWEAVVLVITCIIIRKFKARFLLSFMTAVISGLLIDGWLMVLGGNGAYESIFIRIVTFAGGSCLIAFGVACFFRTCLPVQVYELSVKEIAIWRTKETAKVKFIFDLIMLAVTALMALFLTHSFAGIGIGTVIVTFVNAPLINLWGKLLDKIEKRG